jgi:hypothetical protein
MAKKMLSYKFDGIYEIVNFFYCVIDNFELKIPLSFFRKYNFILRIMHDKECDDKGRILLYNNIEIILNQLFQINNKSNLKFFDGGGLYYIIDINKEQIKFKLCIR